MTGLMYNRRVAKSHPRVEAYGSVDELNAALGVVRATTVTTLLQERVLAIQKDLVILMGELATLEEDLPRYVKDGFTVVSPELTAKLDAWVKEIEAGEVSFKGWATPGGTLVSAHLDVARTTCRRAERRIGALAESGQLANGEILVYLNRLSDLLWLMARWDETRVEREMSPKSA